MVMWQALCPGPKHSTIVLKNYLQAKNDTEGKFYGLIHFINPSSSAKLLAEQLGGINRSYNPV